MKKILAVVDMQNDFISGALGSVEAQNIIENIAKKIEEYQRNGQEIVFTRDTHEEDYLTTQEGKNLPIPHCIRNTKGWQIHSRFQTRDAKIIDKPVFGSLELAEYIKAKAFDYVELVGVCTDICIISNAIILKAALPEGIIAVSPDCCAGVTKESHVQALQAMKLCQIVINEEHNQVAAKEFDAEQVKKDVIKWIQEWFEENGKGCNAIVGISGGKDSSIVAALCVEALGKERVLGVLMPKGEQHDIDMAHLLVKSLDIKSVEINIKKAYDDLVSQVEVVLGKIETQTQTNLPPRIRMTTLYAVSQSQNGRVANTCNLSEDYVGYSTRYGDCAGDFSPLSHLTVTEVKQIGNLLGLPKILIDKVPIDGLCGKTDEENLGFSYEVLDRYIRLGICEDEELKEKIDRMHAMNQFKLELMPSFRLQ